YQYFLIWTAAFSLKKLQSTFSLAIHTTYTNKVHKVLLNNRKNITHDVVNHVNRALFIFHLVLSGKKIYHNNHVIFGSGYNLFGSILTGSG
ncbi:MAG TPA: hypothetical protein VFJ51_07835, partial [Nitrososphaeraceae archaeon]|nr:hypothetical protein [Nitrososphaeraceae archaeon]